MATVERSEIVDRAAAAGSVRDVFRAASGALRRLVAFDAAVWFATDPATSLPVAPTRVEGMDAFGGRNDCLRLWELEFHYEDVNLYADLGRAATPAAALGLATDGCPARSARFRQFLRPAGFQDELRAVLRVDGEPWAALSLLRGAGAPAFDERDTALIAELSAPLARAVRDRVCPARPGDGAGAHGPGVLLFDPAGELVSVNDDARAWLEEIDADVATDASFGVRVPLVVLSTLAQARAIAAERDDRPARVRLRSAAGHWLVCHASCLRDAEGRVRETALVIEPAKASEIAPMLTAAYGLSPREVEITGLVARGASTADIAAALTLSAHTVRDHVKAIFEKVGVSSRGELVARLFADHAAPRHFAPGEHHSAA